MQMKSRMSACFGRHTVPFWGTPVQTARGGFPDDFNGFPIRERKYKPPEADFLNPCIPLQAELGKLLPEGGIFSSL